jgi:cysteinyl-tRNA synthetase
MLKLFNTMGKQLEAFRPVNEKVVTIFTCGPSVYQKAHIGNFRTFLFEDILVRYLEYTGYRVERGLILTDIEDKALREAKKQVMSLKSLTKENTRTFIQDMNLLRIKQPDYFPRASECVDESVEIIERLLSLGIAYRYGGNIYFDPLKFTGFGRLYGLDMAKWPKERRRFHKDTYPGMQWNLGDFILWHGCGRKKERVCWDTPIGMGRPSWNVQDASMVCRHFDETLSIYCGGIDNLFRHHDYSIAILESIRPYPMARFWLHAHHLYVNGRKMSKSTGNIVYTDTLRRMGYLGSEIRFFLIYGHYRKKIYYTDRSMFSTVEKLRTLKKQIKLIAKRGGNTAPLEGEQVLRIRTVFTQHMDDDLDVKGAFDEISSLLLKIRLETLSPGEAAGITKTMEGIDGILKIFF